MQKNKLVLRDLIILLITILQTFKNRELTILFSLIGCSVSLYILVDNNIKSFSDKLGLVTFFFTVSIGCWQWFENKAEKRQQSVDELKKELGIKIDEFNASINRNIHDLRKETRHNDDLHENQIDNLQLKLENITATLNSHIESIGHDYATKEMLGISKIIFHLEAVLNVQSKYAEFTLIAEQMKTVIKSNEELPLIVAQLRAQLQQDRVENSEKNIELD